MRKNKYLTDPCAAPRTVAALMSRELSLLSPRMTAREALARLRQVGVPRDLFTNCYVVDEQGRLLGLLTVRALLSLPENARLSAAMERPQAVLSPEDDPEEAAALLDRLDVSELPVTDLDGRLEGTIALNVAGALRGASFFRVHDVKENVRALRMARAVMMEGRQDG